MEQDNSARASDGAAEVSVRADGEQSMRSAAREGRRTVVVVVGERDPLGAFADVDAARGGAEETLPAAARRVGVLEQHRNVSPGPGVTDARARKQNLRRDVRRRVRVAARRRDVGVVFCAAPDVARDVRVVVCAAPEVGVALRVRALLVAERHPLGAFPELDRRDVVLRRRAERARVLAARRRVSRGRRVGVARRPAVQRIGLQHRDEHRLARRGNRALARGHNRLLSDLQRRRQRLLLADEQQLVSDAVWICRRLPNQFLLLFLLRPRRQLPVQKVHLELPDLLVDPILQRRQAVDLVHHWPRRRFGS